MQESAASRKVQVVYFLSRAGQIEHPHLLEVSVPPNQGLYLRDVKKRLSAIRGNKLPSAYSWSYKRIYRTGYVWQDLCDDDLIFPSNGCEYVLKGSELVTETISSDSSSDNNGSSKEQASVSNRIEPNAKELCSTPTISTASLVECGTDAATQTEEVRKPEGRHSRAVQSADEEDDDDEEAAEEHRRRQNSEVKAGSQCEKYRNGINGGARTNTQNATELDIKSDLPSPPSSSSTNSSSPYNKNLGRLVAMEAAAHRYAKSATAEINSTINSTNHITNNSNNIRSAASTPGRSNWKKLYNDDDATEIAIGAHQKLISIRSIGDHSDGELGNVINRNMSVISNGAAQSAQINSNNSKQNSGKSGSKHGGALSLLQFMSCGGLDIKEQILPMSLYRLRSKGSAGAGHTTICSNSSSILDETESNSGQLGCEVFSYGGPEGNKSWIKLGCTSKPRMINQQKLTISDDYGVYDVHDLYDNSGAHSRVQQQSQQQQQQCGLQGDYGVTVSASMVTERCLNTSRELGYFSQKSGEIKSLPLKLNSGSTNSSSRELHSEHRSDMEAPVTAGLRTRTLSGEMKGSPLFVPGKQYADAGNLINANNYRSKHLSQINHPAQSSGPQSMAQLWDELLTPAKEEMEKQRCLKSEERTLQNALDMSLPSVELLMVHECPNCNRKVKPELLKSHMKNCSSLKSNQIKCNNSISIK